MSISNLYYIRNSADLIKVLSESYLQEIKSAELKFKR